MTDQLDMNHKSDIYRTRGIPQLLMAFSHYFRVSRVCTLSFTETVNETFPLQIQWKMYRKNPPELFSEISNTSQTHVRLLFWSIPVYLHLYPIFMNEISRRDRSISPSPLLVLNLLSAAQIYYTSFINLQRSKISQWNDNK